MVILYRVMPAVAAGCGLRMVFEEKVVELEFALLASSQDGNQDALRRGARPGAVAAPDLAVHDGWANASIKTRACEDPTGETRGAGFCKVKTS